jgi:transcriptional regulator with XRE-family HTH domain
MTAPASAAALGARLQAARKAVPLTQAQAAEMAWVGRSRLSEWEAGMHMPGTDTLQRLAGVYGVSVDSLLGLSGLPDGAGLAQADGTRPLGYWAGRLDEIADAMALQVERLRAVSATVQRGATETPAEREARLRAEIDALVDAERARQRAAGDGATRRDAAEAKPRRRRAGNGG